MNFWLINKKYMFIFVAHVCSNLHVGPPSMPLPPARRLGPGDWLSTASVPPGCALLAAAPTTCCALPSGPAGDLLRWFARARRLGDAAQPCDTRGLCDALQAALAAAGSRQQYAAALRRRGGLFNRLPLQTGRRATAGETGGDTSQAFKDHERESALIL